MGHPRIRTDWESIKTLVASGVTYAEISEKYGIKPEALRKKASREQWPTVDIVNNKAKELAQTRQAMSVTSVTGGVSEPSITEMVADSWLERGEKHRLLAFNLAHSALNRVKAPKIKGWRDLETADKVARRAAGLENEGNTQVNVGLTLVNQRLSQVCSLDMNAPTE